MRLDDLSMMREHLDTLGSMLDGLKKLLDERTADLRAEQARLRQLRNKTFPTGYFSDVAWEILVDLDRAHHESRSLAMSDLGLDSSIPLSTILRYVQKMEEDGFLLRAIDPDDGRRTIVTLSEKGHTAMSAIFDQLVLTSGTAAASSNIVNPSEDKAAA